MSGHATGDDSDALTGPPKTRDNYQPLTAADVTDLAGLPRRFDLFVAETRQSFELLVEKVVAPIVRIGEQISDLVARVNVAERERHDIQLTQIDHARRIEALEAARVLKRKRRKGRTTRKPTKKRGSP